MVFRIIQEQHLLKWGVGLANSRNRVEAFNGLFNIKASPCEGVSLEVSVPL